MEFEYDGGIIIYSYAGRKRIFLFLKRKEGWLDIPKGHIERSESARDAAVRETFEESGLRVEPDMFFEHSAHYWFRADGKTIKKTVTILLARVKADAKVKVSHEHVGYEWLELEEAMRKMSFENAKETLRVANDYIDRLEKMQELNSEYGKLPEKVRGWSLSRKLVPGEGPLNAKVMLIGQAPGRHEEEQGRPFVGISGKLLDKLIRSAGLRREEVYITSTVQFFPPKNRIPSEKEISLCRGFLERQIQIIGPKVIVLLGAVAARDILGAEKIMKMHGKLVKRERDYFITIHPAAAVRLKKNVPVIESDFKKLSDTLRELGPH